MKHKESKYTPKKYGSIRKTLFIRGVGNIAEFNDVKDVVSVENALNSFEADRELIERLKTANDYLVKSLNSDSQATLDILLEADKDRELIKGLVETLKQLDNAIALVWTSKDNLSESQQAGLKDGYRELTKSLTHAKNRGF